MTDAPRVPGALDIDEVPPPSPIVRPTVRLAAPARGRLRSRLVACVAAVSLAGCTPPPRTVPELFAPGVISSAPAFSPDGDTVYFTRKHAIVVAHRRGDSWTVPEVLPFSGRWADSDPAMAPDGSHMVFVSNRPAAEPGAELDGEWGYPERKVQKGLGANLWRVDRRGDGWGPATRLPDSVNRGTAVFEPSIVADGSLFFMDAHVPGRFRFYRSQYESGGYLAPEPLPFSDGTWSDWDATVAPDESFMVFASDRPPVVDTHGDHLFIVFRDGGAWRRIAHLGAINDAQAGSVKPRLGPDHHTLYFSSDRALPATLQGAVGAAPAGFHLWRVDLAQWLR